MGDVSLTLIQTFYLVARTGSYSAAARQLGLSYQSAANHVRRLEQIVGDQLVKSEQGQKRIELTPRGRSLYTLLHPELDIMLERLSLVVRDQRPMLRIGLPQAIFFYLMPPVLRRFREAFPTIELLCFERDTVLAEMVKNGSLDVCISERFFGDPVVPQKLLGTYHLSLVYPLGWDGPPPRSEDVPEWAIDRPFVTFEPGQTLRNQAMDFLGRGGRRVQPSISTSGSSSVKRCVEEGLGFGIIPSWCLSSADADRLVAVTLDTLPAVKVYFGHAQFLTGNTYVTTLLDLLTEELPPSVLRPPSATAADGEATATAT